MLLLRSSGFCTGGIDRSRCSEQDLAMVSGSWRRSLSSSRTRFPPLLLPQQAGNTHRRTITRCCSSPSPPPLFSSSVYSPPLESPIDLSDYLMNGCNWRDAPRCPDYVGPISVERTPDGRGRGLYASRDFAPGDILIISNAFAASYNDPHTVKLYAKFAAIVQQSPKALGQIYCLAGYDFHDDMEVPNVKLFDASTEYTDNDPPKNLKFSEKRIMHIMNVNSFEGELPSLNSQPDTHGLARKREVAHKIKACSITGAQLLFDAPGNTFCRLTLLVLDIHRIG